MDLTVSRAYGRYVVISDEALIVVERRSEEERRQASMIAFVVGGVLGPILAATLDRIGMPGGPMKLYLQGWDTPGLAQMSDVTTCWASEVPQDVAKLPDWPRVEGYRPVTFYPRATIASISLSLRRGLLLTLKREAARHVTVPLPPWDRAKVKAHLTRAGYVLPG